MESIKLTEFKDILSGKYKKNNKEYPLILGIRENQKGNRFITAAYIDNENNKINVLLNWEVDEIKDKVTYKILENKKLSKKIEEYRTLIKNFKEFFKIIKSLGLFNIIKYTLGFDISLNISEIDLAYWIYSKIYYGEINREDFIDIIRIGKEYIKDLSEKHIEDIAKIFIEKGLSISQTQNLTIEI
jgi:hypothetical protein